MNVLLILAKKKKKNTQAKTLEAEDRELFKAAERTDRSTIEKENDGTPVKLFLQDWWGKRKKKKNLPIDTML